MTRRDGKPDPPTEIPAWRECALCGKRYDEHDPEVSNVGDCLGSFPSGEPRPMLHGAGWGPL